MSETKYEYTLTITGIESRERAQEIAEDAVGCGALLWQNGIAWPTDNLHQLKIECVEAPNAK